MRFFDRMIKAAQQLSHEGWIVIMPYVTFVGAEQETATKKMLDDMHFAKIRMSDAIHVVSDETGYIGDSTRNEINYALRIERIEVHYLFLDAKGNNTAGGKTL